MRHKYRIVEDKYKQFWKRLAKDTALGNCYPPYRVEIKKWWFPLRWGCYLSFNTKEEAMECIEQLKAGTYKRKDNSVEQVVYEDE